MPLTYALVLHTPQLDHLRCPPVRCLRWTRCVCARLACVCPPSSVATCHSPWFDKNCVADAVDAASRREEGFRRQEELEKTEYLSGLRNRMGVKTDKASPDKDTRAAADAAMAQREGKAKKAVAEAAMAQREEKAKKATMEQREEKAKKAAAAAAAVRASGVMASTTSAAAMVQREEKAAAEAAMSQRQEKAKKAAAEAAMVQREEKAAAEAAMVQREEKAAAEAAMVQREAKAKKAAADAASALQSSSRLSPERTRQTARNISPRMSRPTARNVSPKARATLERLHSSPIRHRGGSRNGLHNNNSRADLQEHNAKKDTSDSHRANSPPQNTPTKQLQDYSQNSSQSSRKNVNEKTEQKTEEKTSGRRGRNISAAFEDAQQRALSAGVPLRDVNLTFNVAEVEELIKVASKSLSFLKLAVIHTKRLVSLVAPTAHCILVVPSTDG